MLVWSFGALIVSVSGVSVDFRDGYNRAVEKARKTAGAKIVSRGDID